MRHISVMRAALCAALLSAGIAAKAETVIYAYDALGRLVGVMRDQGSSTAITTIYRYDKADNRFHVDVAKQDSVKRPIFRFWSTGGHFYTVAFTEGHEAGLTAEGATFNLLVSNGAGRYGLYRCYNSTSNAHFVSASSSCEGTTVEGLMGYAASASGANLVQLHRCYRASDKDYLITLNQAECTNGGYGYEGALGYVPA